MILWVCFDIVTILINVWNGAFAAPVFVASKRFDECDGYPLYSEWLVELALKLGVEPKRVWLDTQIVPLLIFAGQTIPPIWFVL